MMPTYQKALLDLLHQHGGQRLPELSVFEVLEHFREQCNQVLQYQEKSIRYRYLERSPLTPDDDGGVIALHGFGGQHLLDLATWTYEHPFHTLPITICYGERKMVCHTKEDVEIALQALLESQWFQKIFA